MTPSDTTSPFTPGQPVQAEYFVGRHEEIQKLIDKASKAAEGRLEVGFVNGERGIGKSSLTSFVRRLAADQYGLLGVHVFLGGVQNLEELVRRVFERLLKESIDTPWYDRIKEYFENNIKKVGLFGVSVQFNATKDDLSQLVHDFATAIRNLVEKLKTEKKGILIVLDDINGLASSADFANWLKSLVDEIATSDKRLPMFLLLVGLEDKRQSLIRLQPSLARVFDLISLDAWSRQETLEFFKSAFDKTSIEVDDEAMQILARHTGGLPVLAHEIGDAAFNLTVNKAVIGPRKINEEDAITAVLSAALIVGKKYVQPQVYDAIRSQRYRSILRTLAKEPLNLRFSRAEIRKKLTPTEDKAFDNFLRRMRKLGVVEHDTEAGPGAYRFINQLHYLYFWMEAERARKSTAQ